MEPTIATEWLRLAHDGKLEMTGVNVIKAFRHRALVQVLNPKGEVIETTKVINRQGELKEIAKVLKECASFKLTQRGRDLLEGSDKKVELAFNRADPPREVEHWLSSLHRLARNAPRGVHLTYSGDALQVLVAGKDGKVKDDPAHRLDSFKVPWHKQ